jgi:hypothetical protein
VSIALCATGTLMKNDGWEDIDYSFSDDQELNRRMSLLINEFCHVFRYHADGNWKSIYKPKYVEKMAFEISQRPSLIRKLLKLKDPVVSNITHAAIELNKKHETEARNT